MTQKRKQIYLKKICYYYNNGEVVYIDDDIKNLKAADELHLPNLKVYQARKD